MKQLVVIFLLIFGFIDCQSPVQKNIQTPENNTVPFTIDGLIIFKGKINGKEVNILWDNGFSFSAVDESFFKKNSLSITKISTKVVDGNGQKLTLQKSDLQSLQIGNTVLSDIKADVVDLSILPVKIDAVLGGDIINQYIWDFDFDNNELHFSKILPEKKFEYDIPFEINKYHPNSHFIVGFINKRPFDIQIDFGSNSEFLTLRNDVLKKTFKNPDKLTFEGWGDISIAGKAKNSTSLLLKNNYPFVLGGTNFAKDRTPFINSKDQTIAEAFLGYRFFKQQGNLVIDPFNKVYKIYTSGKKYEPYSFSNFGFSVFVNQGNLTIVKVIRESKNIKKYNLEIGDTIKSIDGHDASFFKSFHDLVTYLEEKKQIKIVLDKNGKEITVDKEIYFQDF